jgi:glycosyltransferase involved in cell wall biosynthesis
MKQVLFITYYWPPSGKASLYWPLGIIKHLPKSGWQPIVLTVKEDSFTQTDNSFAKDLPLDLKVIRSKTYEPFKLYKKFTGKKADDQLIASETISIIDKRLTHLISIWLRMNLFIPDARMGWYWPATSIGNKIFNREKIDAIVTIGPPHTTHLVGKKLSKKFNVPHVPVFIDPWVDIVYYKNFKRNRVTLKIDNHLEKLVVENAKEVVFVTETMRNDYLNKYEFLADKSNVLYWGYNEEDFENVTFQKEKKDAKVLVHAGNIFSYQNPVNLWKEIKKNNVSRNNIKIKFIGTVDPDIKKTITESGLDAVTEYPGFLPYYDMLKEICEADFLLVCATEPRHVPGKLFEYIRTGNPIIAFGDDNDEVKKLLDQSNSGMIFKYEESGEEFFNNFNSLVPNPDYIKQFDRKNISKGLSKILDSI